METKKEPVLKEIEELPDALIDELLNCVQFLKMKLCQEKLCIAGIEVRHFGGELM